MSLEEEREKKLWNNFIFSVIGVCIACFALGFAIAVLIYKVSFNI